MRKYEIVTILSPDLSEVQLKDEIKKLESHLQANGAKGIETDRWAKRDLGFRMKQAGTGTYVFFKFETESSPPSPLRGQSSPPSPLRGQTSLVDQMTSLLRISDVVLKFQVHRISDRVRKFKGMIRKGSPGDGGADDFVDGAEAEYLSGYR